MASATERSDNMLALSRVLMGLSYPLQLCSVARPHSRSFEWASPPRLERRWLVVVNGADDTELDWRVRTLKGAFDGVGLRCSSAERVRGPDRSIRPGTDHTQTSEGFAATLVLRRWPREVSPGWLGQALAEDLAVDTAIHLEPQDPQRVARFLKSQTSWQSVDNDAANQLGKRDAEKTREKLIARTDRPVRVAVAMTVRAPDRDTLKRHVSTLQHTVGLNPGADLRLAKYEQDRGLLATEARGECNLYGAWRTLDCTSVASTWLFQPATVSHANGADIGTTHEGSLLVRLDPFDPSLESFGGVVLAKVGAGKSYFLKLLALRLAGVEVLIVEQRTPAEYRGIPAVTLNLADLPLSERADCLRRFVSELWEMAKRSPKPRLLVLDELWSLLRDPSLAVLVEEIARIGRHHYLALWIATQQVSEMLATNEGKAVLDNAAVRVLLKQHDRDLEALCNATGLPVPARRFLRSAARGQALIDVGGMLIPVDVQATPEEHRLVTTDPRELHHARLTNLDHAGGHGSPAGAALGSPDREGDLRSGNRSVPVAAAG